MSEYFFLALVLLVCPVLMVLMMRGHHHATNGSGGHAGCGPGGHNGDAYDPSVSLDDLRRERDELDAEISERERQGASSGARSAERV